MNSKDSDDLPKNIEEIDGEISELQGKIRIWQDRGFRTGPLRKYHPSDNVNVVVKGYQERILKLLKKKEEVSNGSHC
jgi:hypothetical protein